MTSPLLVIDNLVVRYDNTPVLEGVTFCVKEGDLVGITGQNGSGKSTLLKTICRKIRENSGSITFAGKDLKSIEPHQLVRGWCGKSENSLNIGISTLWQSSLVFPSLTVQEHIQMALQMNPFHQHSLSLDAIYAEFEPRGLPDLRKRLAGNLSGGQRQLLSLAILMGHNNCFWQLDEPFAGLDAGMVDFTIDWLRKKNKAGVTMLVVAHEIERLQQFCKISRKIERGYLQ